MFECPLCHMGVADYPEDHAYHDKYHAALMYPIEPKVQAQFLKLVETEGNCVHVDYSSPNWLQDELYFIARRCMRDLELCETQWENNGQEEPNAHGFLFNDDTNTFGHGAIVGGGVVRWRRYQEVPKSWWLEWAWITPDATRKGVLTRNWNYLSTKFENLQLAPPHTWGVVDFTNSFVAKQSAKLALEASPTIIQPLEKPAGGFFKYQAVEPSRRYMTTLKHLS